MLRLPHMTKNMGHVMRWMIMLAVVALSGCAVGIQPEGEYPSETFTAPVSFQEAYRRADAQPRECVPNMTITGNLFTDNNTGIVRVTMPSYSGSDLVRVNLKQITNNNTEVTVTASDNGVFDKGQVIAMKQSILTGKTSCRSPKYNKFE